MFRFRLLLKSIDNLLIQHDEFVVHYEKSFPNCLPLFYILLLACEVIVGVVSAVITVQLTWPTYHSHFRSFLARLKQLRPYATIVGNKNISRPTVRAYFNLILNAISTLRQSFLKILENREETSIRDPNKNYSLSKTGNKVKSKDH